MKNYKKWIMIILLTAITAGIVLKSYHVIQNNLNKPISFEEVSGIKKSAINMVEFEPQNNRAIDKDGILSTLYDNKWHEYGRIGQTWELLTLKGFAEHSNERIDFYDSDGNVMMRIYNSSEGKNCIKIVLYKDMEESKTIKCQAQDGTDISSLWNGRTGDK